MQNTMLRIEVAAELVKFIKNVATGVINSIKTFSKS